MRSSRYHLERVDHRFFWNGDALIFSDRLDKGLAQQTANFYDVDVGLLQVFSETSGYNLALSLACKGIFS
jgi:hypothetical protein